MQSYIQKSDLIYEGEWWFSCRCEPPTIVVEFSFYELDRFADYFLDIILHRYEECSKCGNRLEWLGFSGNYPITLNLKKILDLNLYSASTVIISAIIENAIYTLLWATLIDKGIEQKATEVLINGKLSRHAQLDYIKKLNDWNKLNDIDFPIRNLLAHGKGFKIAEKDYLIELIKQTDRINNWLEEIIEKNHIIVSYHCPNQKDRWFLFMRHWIKWLKNEIGGKASIIKL